MLDFTDIYNCMEFVNDVKKKYINLDDEPLDMGIFGYLGEIHANILQNSAQTAAENSLEALPTKTKYVRNLYQHAYSNGLAVEAVPAMIEACLILPEDSIMQYMNKEGEFVLDRESKIFIGEYTFYLDYDIIIKRDLISDIDIRYTAQYDMSTYNPISDITNPYIQSIGRFTISGNINVIMMNVILRQIKYEEIVQTIYTSNNIQNKVFSFEYTNNLAAFLVHVEEGDETYDLLPVYDGLIPNTTDKFINYMYMGDNIIRCIFNRDSYQPTTNCKVYIRVYSTQGSEGNFTYNKNTQNTLNSDRFGYKNIWMIVKTLSDSTGGEDMKSAEELQTIIPKEQLARGTVTSTQDLENFFNSINTSDLKLYFVKKLDSIKRIYYAYLAIKYNDNMIPTNTIDINLNKYNFDDIQYSNCMVYPGNCIYYDGVSNASIVTSDLSNSEKMDNYRENGFLYFNPFFMIINKNPFYVTYLINIINCSRELSFNYINQSSPIQFIVDNITWKREYFTDRNKYKLLLPMTVNVISKSNSIYNYDKSGTIIESVNVEAIAVLKATDGVTPYRYAKGKYDEEESKAYVNGSGVIVFTFEFETDDTFDTDMNIKIKNLYDIGATTVSDGYFNENTNIDLYICPRVDNESSYSDTSNYRNIVPGTGYICSNIYSIINGVPMFYNYSNMISTFINVRQTTDDELNYIIKKVPVIRYDYIDEEYTLLNILNQINLIKSHVEYLLSTIEDGFGIDIKFFNTYGPAKFFKVAENVYLDNVCLLLKFKTKLKTSASDTCIDDIKVYIKNYIEDFDNIGDLHISNLLSVVLKEFSEQIEYFEYTGVNDYGISVQHLYRTEFEYDITIVPELLSISIKDSELEIVIEQSLY